MAGIHSQKGVCVALHVELDESKYNHAAAQTQNDRHGISLRASDEPSRAVRTRITSNNKRPSRAKTPRNIAAMIGWLTSNVVVQVIQ